MIVRDSIGLPGFISTPKNGLALGGACRALVLRAVETFETWAARVQQRRQLAGLDARMLRDIGRSEADVMRETGKPFWRA